MAHRMPFTLPKCIEGPSIHFVTLLLTGLSFKAHPQHTVANRALPRGVIIRCLLPLIPTTNRALSEGKRGLPYITKEQLLD